MKLDDRFLSHFKFNLIGREDLNGRSSYMVTVLPAPSPYPIRSNSEKVFSHMEGKVWVDAGDYSLVKCDLHLTEPTSFYGILGAVRQLDFFWQRQFQGDKVWLTDRLNFEVAARRLFTPINMRQESTFTHFKKMAD